MFWHQNGEECQLFMKRLLIASGFLVSSLFGVAVQADEAVLFSCIKKYTALGISPDAALAECKQKSIKSCVKSLLGQPFIASSIKKGPEGHLIDLGDQESRWMEGKAWKSNDCTPFVEGPKREESVKNMWDTMTRYQWFRQGWCQSSELDLGGSNSLQDAKQTCEIRSIKDEL